MQCKRYIANGMRKVQPDGATSFIGQLAKLLTRNRVLMHPVVIGELACGNLKNRQSLLKLWNSLNTLIQASHEEVLYFIEHHHLMGKGIGYLDGHLLASVALAMNVRLWTHDLRLSRLAIKLDLA